MPSRAAKFALSTLIIFVVSNLSGCGDKSPENDAKPPVSRPAMILTLAGERMSQISFTGIIRSAERAELSFRQSGKLETMRVQEGDRVSRGQVLATIDSKELTTSLNSARVEFNQANVDFERANKIFKASQAISRSALDQLKAKRDLAANKVTKAKQELENTSIIAPFSGVISQKLKSNFATVQANQPIYVMHNPDDMEVLINVPSKLFLAPVSDQKAVAEIEGLPSKRFNLTYRYFASDADPVSQTHQVVLGFDDHSGVTLLPGMSARVFAVMTETTSPGSILIPIDAIVPSNTGSQFVWLVDPDSTVQQQEVDVGNILGNQIEVIEGLSINDRIVVAGVQALTSGMKVHPMTAEGTR
jgi:RND family efflux transporter MFP subunit